MSTMPALLNDYSHEDKLYSLLQDKFGFSQFRKGQLDILKSVLASQDALAVMPTGGGKSLCYQIPALYQTGIVIVISPLISLMRDQVKSLKEIGVPAGCLHTGQTYAEKQEVFAAMKTNACYLLYLSPERAQKPGFSTWIKTQNISLFAIDESHCVSQWGPEFRQDYHRLGLLRELKPEVPILALTATATPQVLRDIIKQLGLKNPNRHIYGFYRPNLYYQVETCENDAVKMRLLRQALIQHPTGRVIIYCGTRKQCEALVSELATEFAGIDFYHAGLSTEDRNRIQEDFAQGRTRILFATNAFGMGIDHPDVRLVVHYQMPANIESYYQEMGRAGRDQKDATCLLLYAKRDKGLHAYFISQSEAKEQHLHQRWQALDTITQFAEGGECRHAGILTYFRDAQRITSCGHCDICNPNSPRRISRRNEIETKQTPMLNTETPSKSRPKKKSFEEEPLNTEAQRRYEGIKTWRKEFAQSKDLPAFLIFSNKTLHALALRNPQSLADLERIYGLGEHKVGEFGEEVLQLLQKLNS